MQNTITITSDDPSTVAPNPLPGSPGTQGGTIIGNMTVFGIANAFDGGTNKVATGCAAISGSPGYVGLQFSSGKKFLGAIYYGPSDRWIVDEGPGNVTIQIRGNNGVPSGPTDGVLLGSVTFANQVISAVESITSTDIVDAYTDIWAYTAGAAAMNAIESVNGVATYNLVGGISFGGLHSMIAAASVPRFNAWFAHVPVTRIALLTEFPSVGDVGRMNPFFDAPALSDTNGWISWGTADTRTSWQYTKLLSRSFGAGVSPVEYAGQDALSHR